jgi:hypothetical protein
LNLGCFCQGIGLALEGATGKATTSKELSSFEKNVSRKDILKSLDGYKDEGYAEWIEKNAERTLPATTSSSPALKRPLNGLTATAAAVNAPTPTIAVAVLLCSTQSPISSKMSALKSLDGYKDKGYAEWIEKNAETEL